MTLRSLFPVRLVAAFAVFVAGTTAARADIILDDFSGPVSSVILGSPMPALQANIPLGTRDTTFTVTSPNPAGTFSLLGVVGGGSVSMFLDSISSGNAVLQYAFTAPLDLQTIGGATGALRLSAQSSATVGNPDVAYTLQLLTASGTLSSSGSFTNSAGFVDRDVAFSSLTGSGDLSKVTGLTLTVTGQTADDFRLSKIAVTQQVPAPAGLVLALAALPILGLRRRFARKA